jgi:hypothetical protein
MPAKKSVTPLGNVLFMRSKLKVQQKRTFRKSTAKNTF